MKGCSVVANIFFDILILQRKIEKGSKQGSGLSPLSCFIARFTCWGLRS